MPFPKNFTWGVATAAYQIEGATSDDGRGPSIWDDFSRRPGKTFEGQTGDVACDHYHRYQEDVQLMRGLGVNGYRFSLSWSRLLPNGVGKPNAKGLAFYDRLIDELLAAGIDPWVTLYHWDLPSALQRRGGWLNREIVEIFGDYAALVASRYGDRVKKWMTINEPPCVIGIGYQDGTFAPGLKLPFSECLHGAHNLLLAHGRGVQALRAGCKGRVKISIAQTGRERIPATRSARDIEAARMDYFACWERALWNLSWWADPVVLGKYPADGLEAFADVLPRIETGDMKLISQKIDYLAYNCYSGWPIRAGVGGKPEKVPGAWGEGNPRGTLPWVSIVPEAPYWAARFQTERYQLPIAFTENGYCNTDFIHLDGAVRDPQRIDFMARYLREIRRACDDGYPVSGYFYWSLMDNFEWAAGYRERFGLVHIDYKTQRRTPKDSYNWYRDMIRVNGANV